MTEKSCIILIGMPGAGKSTIGKKLAALLSYAFIDSDFLIEALYARRLQDVTNSMPRKDFLDVEGQMICAIRARKCVIATGGSVIYRPAAMQHLQSLGAVVHLQLSLEETARRVANNPERGISFGPGQTLADLYAERMEKYRQYADLTCDTDQMNPQECAAWINTRLSQASGWPVRKAANQEIS